MAQDKNIKGKIVAILAFLLMFILLVWVVPTPKEGSFLYKPITFFQSMIAKIGVHLTTVLLVFATIVALFLLAPFLPLWGVWLLGLFGFGAVFFRYSGLNINPKPQ